MNAPSIIGGLRPSTSARLPGHRGLRHLLLRRQPNLLRERRGEMGARSPPLQGDNSVHPRWHAGRSPGQHLRNPASAKEPAKTGHLRNGTTHG